MSYSFLKPDTIFDTYDKAKAYTDSLTDAFPEHERIARNKPHPKIDPAYPKTTDGTTASIIRKTPKRVIQQLPTGVVKADDDDWLGIVAGFVYTDKILPHANEEYDLIQKCWTTVEKGLTHGACATYAPFLSHDGFLSPDLTIPYWGDIFLQKGKKSGYACSYIFMRSWWQKEDLQSLIDQENARSKDSKSYKATWDIANLEAVLDAVTTKDEKSLTPTERTNNKDVASGIELVTGFQKGVGAKFFTFHPQSKLIVRTKVNKDPRGKMPIDWMYGDIDGTNPLGRGIVDLVGPLQNLIDADMQMYQFNRALMLAPPLKKKGSFSKNKIKYVPNAIIDLGNDVNADIIPLSVDTSAIANYPQLYGLQKSQLLNLTASPDQSISSEVGNPGFSKTPEGLKQQQATVSVDDNYVRKMFEAWFQNWSETAINLYFAERTGIEELQLDDDTADQLRKLAQEGKFDESMLSEDNKIRINYDTATPALKFEVDASTSKMKNDAEQRDGLTGLLTALDQSPVLQQVIPPEKIISVWNSIVDASGVEDPEDLKVSVDDFKQQQQMQQDQAMQQQQMQTQQAQAQAQQAQAQQPQMPDPQMQQMQSQPQDQQPLGPEDQQLSGMLQQAGASPDQIQAALVMLHQGASPDEIMQMLSGGMQ